MLDGWMNATSAPSAPGLGLSSISDAAGLQLLERGADVVHPQRDVVETRTAPPQKPQSANRARSLQQLEAAFSRRDKVRTLTRHVLRRVHLTKSVPIETQRRVEIRDRDANVIENSFHSQRRFITKDEEHEGHEIFW